uniref:hemin uptake protein HemP n=1 Tax=Hylemonella sp. TaxID=2066020 RepID=UPI0035B198C8
MNPSAQPPLFAQPTAPATDPADTAGVLRQPGGPSLDSQALLQGGRAVSIRHNGEVYRLQATRQGKLILTK